MYQGKILILLSYYPPKELLIAKVLMVFQTLITSIQLILVYPQGIQYYCRISKEAAP